MTKHFEGEEPDSDDAEVAKEILHMVASSVKGYAIICMDKIGKITLWSRGAEEIFGWTSDDVIGSPADIIFTPEDREQGRPETEMAVALRDGEAPDERFHIRADGVRFFCSGLMMVMRDQHGIVRGFVKIARDVTQERSIERAKRDQAALAGLLSVQEEERKRFSRDLHDELGQEITALRLQLKSIQTEYSGDQKLILDIEKAKEIARRLDRGIDHLAWEIRPTILEKMSLSTAIDEYAKHWGEYFGIKISVLGVSSPTRYAPETEGHVYRIVQEALNNSAKHSKAKAVSIVMTQRDDSLKVVIEDDGIGFHVEETPASGRSMGLTGMYERAVLMNGKLQIESEPGKGTTIFLTVPLTSAEE